MLFSGKKLHTVVGRFPLTAGKLLFILTVHKYSTPASATGITAAGAVCIKLYFFHFIILKGNPTVFVLSDFT